MSALGDRIDDARRDAAFDHEQDHQPVDCCRCCAACRVYTFALTYRGAPIPDNWYDACATASHQKHKDWRLRDTTIYGDDADGRRGVPMYVYECRRCGGEVELT